MKQFSLILVYICFFQYTKAQDTSKVWQYAITCKPLGLINPILPNFTAGLLLKLNKNVAIELQGAYIFNYHLSNYLIYEKTAIKGVKGNLELKYFVQDGFYTGLQFFYQSYTKEVNEYYLRNARTYQELFTIEKQIYTSVGHFKIGVLMPLANKLLLDIYVGGGLRYKMVNQVSTLPEDAEAITRRGVNFGTDQIGNQFYPSINTGFSIGYILK